MTLAAREPAAAEVILELRGITKDFPGVRALDGVDLEVRRGEVLGLVGENGAGKSTLIKILGGVYPHGDFGGEVLVDGKAQRFAGVAGARAAGVAIVHQELCLVPEMTVAENLLLGEEPRRFGLIDRPLMVSMARAMLARFGEAGARIDAEAPVSRLGVGQQQLVEIARAVGTQARVVVLDEPTAALTEAETEKLFEVVAEARAAGTSFVYISHRLDEIETICDRVTVLRDGRHIETRAVAETDQDQLVSLMIGADPASLEFPHTTELGDTVLRIEHLTATDHRGVRVLDDVSLRVRAGEVVALAGAMGAGRTALLSALFGALRGQVSGRVEVGGAAVELRNPAAAIAAGLALVPEDRKGAGLVLEMSVGENLSLAALGRFARLGAVDVARESTAARREARRLGVKAPSLGSEVRTLSGGNQQKVVLGKWLMTSPRVLLLDEPTRGVDVGAKAEIYRIIRELTREGLAVLMASSDLPEVQHLADRVLVLRDGRIAGELTPPADGAVSQEDILALAVGRAGAKGVR